MYEGYLQMGCGEILNASRAYWYSHTADCPVEWLKLTYCDNLADALNGQVPYHVDDIATAPWYDERDPATARFYGAYPISITGLTDSTRTATITEGILDGGMVGGYRNAVRKVDVRAILLARGQDALESGLSWLDAALRPDECGIHGETCGESDLEFFNSCPPRHGSNPGFSPWEMTATNLVTTPSFETASGTVEVYRNLATNPSMEAVTAGSTILRTNLATVPIPTLLWLSNNATLYSHSLDATGGRRGGPALKVTRTASTPNNLLASMYCVGTTAWNVAGRVPVTPGQVVSISVYVRTDAPNTSGTISAYFFDAANAAVGGAQVSPAVSLAGGAWQQVTHTVTVPANATNLGVGAGVSLTSGTSVGGEVTYFTDAQIEVSPSPTPYFDGSFLDANGWDYGWSGTANASTSTAKATAVLIRTNQLLNPRMDNSVSNWTVAGTGVTQTAAAGGTQVDFASALTNNLATLYAGPATSASGESAYAGIEVTVPAGFPAATLTVRIQGYLAGGGSQDTTATATSAPVTIQPGQTVRLTSPAATGTATTVGGWRMWLNVASPGVSAGGRIIVRNAILEKSAVTTASYFDGTRTPDSDLTPAWTGTADASTSTLSGAKVGIASGGVIGEAVWSTQWADNGIASMRVIPNQTSSSNQSRAILHPAITVAAGEVYTVMAKFRMTAAQTGSLWSEARKLSVYFAQTATLVYSTAAPNQAGVTELRMTVTVPAGNTTMDVRGNLGSPAGDAEGWFDSLAIVAGTYTGPYFDGATPLVDVDFTTAWAGAAHGSATTVTGAGVAGLSTQSNVKCIQSTRWSKYGAKSVRIIPTGTVYGYVVIPVGLPTETRGTAVLTMHLEAPITGTQNTNARKMYWNPSPQAFSNQAPNVAGDTELRVYSDPTPGIGSNLVVVHGGLSGSGDIWIDGLLRAEGQHTGGYFDGDTPDTLLDDYGWTGTANASTSTHATRSEIQIPWTEEEYQARVDPYWRVLHGVTCVSGPLVEQKLRRDAEGGGIWAYVVKFTLAASTPFVFSLPASVPLPSTSPVVVSDTPVNLVPYPSVGLTSGVVEVSRNYMRNPSGETDNSNWAVAYDGTSITTGAVIEVPSTQNPVSGTKSIKQVYTAPATSAVAGWFAAQQEAINLPTVAGTRVSFTVSATNSAAAGTVLGDLEIHAIWRNGTTTLRDDTIGKIGTGVVTGTFSVKSLVPPATTNAVIVQVRQRVTSRTSGNVVNVWIDAVAVTVP